MCDSHMRDDRVSRSLSMAADCECEVERAERFFDREVARDNLDVREQVSILLNIEELKKLAEGHYVRAMGRMLA